MHTTKPFALTSQYSKMIITNSSSSVQLKQAAVLEGFIHFKYFFYLTNIYQKLALEIKKSLNFKPSFLSVFFKHLKTFR